MAGNDGGVNTDGPTCMAGGACVPANACHKGAFVCMEGAMSCGELPDLQANGTECGTDMVCNSGTCTACQAGMACNVANKPCRVGTIVCTTGAPVCTETDNKPNGTGCGTGMVCQAGACVACQAGASCEPTNRCHTGTLQCTGGTPTCMDTNTNVPPGTTCGQDRVCNAGACTDCTVGATCNVTGKPCRRGTTACNTGAPVCLEAGDQPNGSVCGNNQVCSAGMCVACTARPRVRAGEPVPRRHHRLLAGDRLQRHRQQPGERHRLRHRPRVQRRIVRVVRRGGDLPAGERVQDRRDHVRDRITGVRRVGQPAERDQLRHQHGVHGR